MSQEHDVEIAIVDMLFKRMERLQSDMNAAREACNMNDQIEAGFRRQEAELILNSILGGEWRAFVR